MGRKKILTPIEIWKSDFVSAVVGDARKFEVISKDKNRTLSKRQLYIWDVGAKAQAVSAKLEMMDRAFLCSLTHHIPKLWLQNFSRADYYQYHLENFLTFVPGILDRCLILTSAVYQLGFNGRAATRQGMVVGNDHLGDTETKATLERFDAFTNSTQVKKARHLVVHAEEYLDTHLSRARVFEFLHARGSVPEPFTKMTPKDLTAEYVFEKRPMFESLRKQTYGHAQAVFASLLDRYRRTVEDGPK